VIQSNSSFIFNYATRMQSTLIQNMHQYISCEYKVW